jgi:thymidylate kinase
MRCRAAPPTKTAGRPLVVELVGTPGSGKSTLALELVALLDDRGVDAATVVGAAREHAARTPAGGAIARLSSSSLRRAGLWQLFYLLGLVHAFGFALDQPLPARRVVEEQLRRRIPVRQKAHTIFWFFQLAGRLRFLTETGTDREVIVVDDGFVHRSVHLHVSPLERADPARVAAYVDIIPPPDLLVWVDADHETCSQRVRERGIWRHSRHWGDRDLDQYLDHASRVVDAAVRRAREKGWNVVEIDNPDGSLPRVRRELGRALDERLPTRASDHRTVPSPAR